MTGEPEMLENLEPVLTRKYFHEVQIFHSEPFYLEVVPKISIKPTASNICWSA